MGRKNPKMCGRTHAPTGSDPHGHVCGENEKHPGQHVCIVPAEDSGRMCGYRW